jgi:chromosome partitioning protein
VLATKIRQNVRLAEAPSHGKTIFEYAPDSPGARDYDDLAAEVLSQTPRPGGTAPASGA